MIKKITYILIMMQIACSPSECFMSAGKTSTKQIEVESFNKILVGNEISLIIKQGSEQKVLVETGENLMDNISVKVIDNELQLEDKTTCNITRDYAITKVFVTSPDIIQIRSNTARTIKSEGTLNYNKLTLVSEDYFNNNFLNIGDFSLTVNNEKLTIVSNGDSVFNINGNCSNLNVGFYSGTSRFNGQNLIAENVIFTHKSTNDILVHPTNSLKGIIYLNGDVISFYQPPIIDVEERYTGRLLFN